MALRWASILFEKKSSVGMLDISDKRVAAKRKLIGLTLNLVLKSKLINVGWADVGSPTGYSFNYDLI